MPCAAARKVEDMFDHPQVQAEGLVEELAHRRMLYRGFAHPVKIGDEAPPKPFAAPDLGVHAAEILAECGYTKADTETLAREGAMGTPNA